MASPPRGQLTSIPEHISYFASPLYNPLSPQKYDMEAVPLRYPGLAMTFYNVPENSAAKFSTLLQTQPKRKLEMPYPPTIVRTNLGLDVQRKCAELRQMFPGVATSVSITKVIDDWNMLYEYFDAVDLWLEGPAFCLYVIHRLSELNKDIANTCHAEIRAFAHGWVQANVNRVLTAPINVDILGLWSEEEFRMQDVGLMSVWEIETLRTELNRFRDILLQTYHAARPAIPPMGPISPPHIIPYNQGPQFRRRDSSARSEVDHNVGRSPQTFHNFMEAQRRRNENGEPPRSRGWSNDTNRGGKTRHNNFGQNRTPRNSPPRHEPIYVLTSQRGASADMSFPKQNIPNRPRAFSGARNFSNEMRCSPGGRRTVSEETSGRNYYNGNRSNYHSRVTSNSSIAVSSPHQLTRVTQNNNEGRLPPVGPPIFNYYDNMKLDILHYPHRIYPTNGSVTIYYSGPERTGADQPLKTVYVAGVPLQMFYNHTFRDMMAECGTVETISHLRNGAGSAFVLFEDEAAVQKAIDKFHGCSMGNGVSLVVNVPTKSRERGHSMSSFRGYRRNSYGEVQFWGPQGDLNHGHARTNSAQVHRESYRPPMPEIPESRGQSPWKPLQDVSNAALDTRGVLQNAAARAYFQPSAASSPKKENSPITTPTRSSAPSPKKSRGKRFPFSRKTSQQNSTQPTPLGSPKRSALEPKSTSENIQGGENKKRDTSQRPNENFHEYVTQALSSTVPEASSAGHTPHTCSIISAPGEQASVVEPASVESALPTQTAPRPKAKNKSKKKANLNNARNMNSSFTTDASADTISPVDDNSDILKGTASTNTSYSAPSSRQPSTNAPSRKAKEPSKKTNEASSSTVPNNDVSEKKTSNESGAMPKVKNNNHKPSKARDPASDSGSDLQNGHQKNRSTSSVASNLSQRKADAARNLQKIGSSTTQVASSVRTNNEQEPVNTTSPGTKSKATGNNHHQISIIIPPPTINAERSSEKQGSSPGISPSTMVQSPTSISEPLMSPTSLPEAATPTQLDEQNWPALATSKSPVTAIADGKPPTPIQAPLAKLFIKVVDEKSPEARKSPDLKKTPKSANFPPVAVPRYFESRSSAIERILRPPTQDEEGSETWPFVRSFRAG